MDELKIFQRQKEIPQLQCAGTIVSQQCPRRLRQNESKRAEYVRTYFSDRSGDFTSLGCVQCISRRP